MQRSLEDRVKIIRLYFSHGSYLAVARHWEAADPPNRETISNTVNRFIRTGSVVPVFEGGAPRSVLTEEGLTRIMDSVEEDATLSKRRRSADLGMSASSLQRGMVELGYRAYRCQIVPELKPEDLIKRQQFCAAWRARLAVDPNLADRIFWTDECKMALDEAVNTRNCYYYSPVNPNYTMEQPVASGSVMVWCAISSRGIIGPHFFQTNVTGKSYQSMLQRFFFPRARVMFPGIDFLLQQDGAPPHTSNIAVNYLNAKLPGKWVGKRGPILWPPRSPDLTPPDFFLWGYVRDRVYNPRPHNLTELKAKIVEVIAAIPLDMCQRVCRSVKHRLQECEEARGGHLHI